jgi:hypothetical protein
MGTMRVPVCPDRMPFDLVTVHRESGEDGELTAWYVLEGRTIDGARQRRIHHDVLLSQAHAHLQIQHGKSFSEPVTPQEWSHALTHAAVAFLIG